MTIQAAVNYVTSTFSLGNFNIFINIGAGTYVENVVLPGYSRGTGVIELRSISGSRDVEISSDLGADGSRSWCVNAGGGVWRLRHIRLSRVEHATTSVGQAFGCAVANGGAELHVFGCAFTQSFPSSTALGGQGYEIRVLCADSSSQIRLQHDQLPSVISCEANANDSDHSVHVFSILRQSSLWLIGSHDDTVSPATTGEFACSGSCDVFATFRYGGFATIYGGGTLVYFTGSVSGKRYNLVGGSSVAGNGRLGVDYFPGTEEGTIESSTYCWYQQ